MKPAARLGDKSAHPGVLTGPGVATVLIGKRPAIVVGDQHTCSFPPPPAHPVTPIPMGSTTVLIAKRGAVRLGDTAGCGAPIIEGCPTVLIGG